MPKPLADPKPAKGPGPVPRCGHVDRATQLVLVDVARPDGKDPIEFTVCGVEGCPEFCRAYVDLRDPEGDELQEVVTARALVASSLADCQACADGGDERHRDARYFLGIEPPPTRASVGTAAWRKAVEKWRAALAAIVQAGKPR